MTQNIPANVLCALTKNLYFTAVGMFCKISGQVGHKIVPVCCIFTDPLTFLLNFFSMRNKKSLLYSLTYLPLLVLFIPLCTSNFPSSVLFFLPEGTALTFLGELVCSG